MSLMPEALAAGRAAMKESSGEVQYPSMYQDVCTRQPDDPSGSDPWVLRDYDVLVLTSKPGTYINPSSLQDHIKRQCPGLEGRVLVLQEGVEVTILRGGPHETQTTA